MVSALVVMSDDLHDAPLDPEQMMESSTYPVARCIPVMLPVVGHMR
jgi:hypothetical protein